MSSTGPTGPVAVGLPRSLLDKLEGALHRGAEQVTERLGGRARRQAIILLACVLGLSSADTGAVGAVAPQLEAAFHIGNTEVGLLVTVSSLVGALATLPIGVLTDRRRRVRLLGASIVVWGVAEAATGLSVSYLMLLLTRLALGVITATAGPTVASLTGDLFPARQRGRIYGFVLTGELVGAGAGILVAGDVAGALGWRAAFFVLGVPSLALAWALHRYLPEPARGGQSWITEGDEDIVSAEEAAAHPDRHQPDPGAAEVDAADTMVRERVQAQGVEPEPSTILHGDPARMNLWEAVRWVLRVRTNVLLIVASSLGYFFFAGLRVFAVIFVRGQYGISQGAASAMVVVVGIGAVVGILVAGRVTDKMIKKGRVNARLVAGAVGYLVAAVVFVPGILTSSLAIALPLFVVAAAALSAPNPPVDAARLDVVPSRMWGRAEAIRTFLRTILEAFAPLLFGFVSQVLGGSKATTGFGAGVNSSHVHLSASSTRGLEYTFLIMLVPLAASGVLLLRGRRTYPTDVASAGVSEEEGRPPAEAAAAGT